MTDMTGPPPGEGLTDAHGRWVPKRLIKDVDLARDELVRELTERAKAASAVLAEFKSGAMADVAAFVELSAAQYGVEIGGRKGNVTLTSYDGRYKIVRAVANRLTFDERLMVAKELIDDCITEWVQGSRDEIRALIEDAFQVDRQGKISTERVLGLRRLEPGDGVLQSGQVVFLPLACPVAEADVGQQLVHPRQKALQRRACRHVS